MHYSEFNPKYLIVSIVFSFLFFSIISCRKKGCTELNALTYNDSAVLDDGSCVFSRCIFYQKQLEWAGEKITKIELFGSYSGDPDQLLFEDFDWVYPTGELNCNSPGTFLLEFDNGEWFIWNARIYTTDCIDPIINRSGMVIANSTNNCIKVDITKK